MENSWPRSWTRPSRRTYLAALFLLAFCLRFGVVLALRDIHHMADRATAGADSIEFNALALHLDSGQGYAVVPGSPTAFRAPGFPLFLAAVYRISYENYTLAYLALCFVGALTCLVTYCVAEQLLTEGFARLAGILAAIYLPHAYFSSIFLSEVLFALCVAVGLWLLLLYLRRPSAFLLAGAGACMGYAALTRPIALLFPLAWVLALLAADGLRSWRPYARAILLLAATVVVVVPWSIRNYAVFHRPVMIATNGGSTFYGSNNDIVLHQREYLGSWISTTELPNRKLIEATPDEVSHDQMELTLGKQWVAAHLLDMPRLLVYKMARFWLPDTTSHNRKFVLMQLVAYSPFAILMVIGLIGTLKPARAFSARWLAVHGILAANLLSTLIFYGSGRFRDSITPVLMIYATVGLGLLVARWTGSPFAENESMQRDASRFDNARAALG